jgi:hypothetical protein
LTLAARRQCPLKRREGLGVFPLFVGGVVDQLWIARIAA